MHIRRFDRDYSRRHFLKAVAAGSGAAGVLMPAWKALAETGEVTRAYPEELLSIEAYTKGRIKPGDVITADNVEWVKDLLEPVKYEQVREMGRRLKVKASTTDLMRLSPWEYLEATLRNQGKARFDEKGNVVGPDGGPWIGGNPFPAAETALELFASLTLNWGRHDASFYAIYEEDLGSEGKVNYTYDAGWAELSPVARTTMEPKPYWPGHEDKLRYQSIVFLSPQSSRGTSFLNIWPYDHSTFPVLYGYVPEFKRVRQSPTDQRFEPLQIAAVEIGRMRIEAGQHAADGGFDHFPVRRFINVFRPDAFEDIAEQIQQPVGIGIVLFLVFLSISRGKDRGKSQGNQESNGERRQYNTNFHSLKPYLCAASHGNGLIGWPSRLNST